MCPAIRCRQLKQLIAPIYQPNEALEAFSSYESLELLRYLPPELKELDLLGRRLIIDNTAMERLTWAFNLHVARLTITMKYNECFNPMLSIDQYSPLRELVLEGVPDEDPDVWHEEEKEHGFSCVEDKLRYIFPQLQTLQIVYTPSKG